MSDQFDCPYPSSSESECRHSDSECQEPPAAQEQKKRKGGPRPPRNEYKAWVGESEMTCEIDGSLSLEDRTEALKETIKNRLSHTLPTGNCVKALAVLVDSKEYSGGSGECKFRIKLYIQTRNTTVLRLQSWLSNDCKLRGLKGGLCGTDEFDKDMKKTAPWVVLPIFSTIKLNNAGRAAKRVIDRYIIPCILT